MRSFSRLVVLGCLVALAPNGIAIGMQPPTKEQVHDLLSGNDFDGYRELIQMGEKAFPAYEAILSDPKADPGDVARVFNVLYDVKVDRRRFLKHAVSRLTDAKFGVRLNAVILLKRIGSPAEASPVIALLSDKDIEIAYAAAKTLAAIGGPNEVVAMDVWLRGVSHGDEAHLRHHVKQWRDALEIRLNQARPKEPSK